MRRVLTIDPGGDGAAALLGREHDGGDVLVLGAVVWRAVSARKHVVSWVRGSRMQRTTVSTIAQVGALGIPGALLDPDGPVPDAVLVEGAFVGVDARASLGTAREAGRIEAALECAAWPGRPPTTRVVDPNLWWRALGMPPARQRADRKRISVAEVPNLIPGMAEVLRLLGRSDHLTDAAGLGAVGLRHAAWDDVTDCEWTARLSDAGTRPRSARRPTPRPVGDG